MNYSAWSAGTDSLWKGLKLSNAVIAILCLACPVMTSAQVVIDNTPPTTTGGSAVSDTDWKAMLFTTGASATQISTIELGLNPPNTGTPPGTWQVNVSIYNVAAGAPTTELFSMGLAPISIAAATQTYIFTPTSTWSLSASTPYALVVNSDATGIRWSNRPGSSPTASGGFSYDGFQNSIDSGLNWTSIGVNTVNAVRITVSAVPEPQETALGAGLGLLALVGFMHRRHRTAWDRS